MLSDEVIDKVIDRLVRRIEIGNEYVLKEIGKSIKKIGTLSPSEAHKLVQILKYGGDYDKIVKKLTEITKLNVKDIYEIFDEIAKSDYQFAKQFYDYRGKKYIPYEQNTALKQQVKALAKMTAKEYINLSRSEMLGFGMQDKNGNITFKGLKKAYNELLDEAVLNVSQGKETFNSAMFRQLKQMGTGLKVIYPSTYITTDDNGNEIIKHRTMRLDSAIRMNTKDAIRSLHNDVQEIYGKQFGADGVEITVHENPAEDHAEAQGKQFSKEEYKKLQKDGVATTYDKIQIDLHKELKSGETAKDFRSISEYNCYHRIYSIVLGVSEPEYSNKELQEIRDRNEQGFDYDGKHYTMYEGTQLQRQLERAIREQKDTQILARASGNEMLIGESQQKITILTRKYKEVCEASGLPRKADRLRVPGYKRVAIQ